MWLTEYGICMELNKCNWWQVSYMILEMVSPVTHSVANSVKRVVIIVSSVIFFQTPVSAVNALGKSLMPYTWPYMSYKFMVEVLNFVPSKHMPVDHLLQLRRFLMSLLLWCACDNRNCYCSCWSFLVLKGKKDEASAEDKLRHNNPSKGHMERGKSKYCRHIITIIDFFFLFFVSVLLITGTQF